MRRVMTLIEVILHIQPRLRAGFVLSGPGASTPRWRGQTDLPLGHISPTPPTSDSSANFHVATHQRVWRNKYDFISFKYFEGTLGEKGKCFKRRIKVGLWSPGHADGAIGFCR